MRPDRTNVRKILVVTLSNLGDVILTLPVFQSLIRDFPAAELHVVVGPGAAVVFADDPRIKKVIPYVKRMPWRDRWDFIRKIRAECYDLIIDLRRSPLGFFGGARFRNSYFSLRCAGAHRTFRHLEAIRGIAQVCLEEPFLRVDAAADRRLESLFAEEAAKVKTGQMHLAAPSRLVVAAVGSKSDVKKWPAERYAELLGRLAVNEACRIVLIGDTHDAADAGVVAALLGERAVNLAGLTDFGQLCAVLKRADLLITNDSAPLHIADALGVPVLALFGPTDPKKYGPRSPDSLAARRVLFCSPCERAQCRYGHECMKELKVSEVYRKACRILNDEPAPQGPKILAIRLDRIGDLVLSFPALEAIKARFPQSSLSVMTRPSTFPIVEYHPAADDVIVYDYEKGGRHRSVVGNFRFILEIIRRRFDIVFILNPSLRSYLVPWVAQIPYRAGFRGRWPFLLTHGIADRRREGKKHESAYTLGVIEAFGIKPAAVRVPVWPVSAYDAQKIESLLPGVFADTGGRIIAIHPGASCPSKRWPKERFADLGRWIARSLNRRVAIVGAETERHLGAYLEREIGGVLDMTGRLSLGELAAFLKRCEALVSNDSGPVHIAAAVGTPVLSIFGRTLSGLSPVRWRPLGEGHAVIQKDVGCVVCLAHQCTIGFECLRALETEEVVGALKGILKNV